MKSKCSCYDKLGHSESTCFLKKKFIRKNKINLGSKRSHLNRSESSQKVEKAKKTCFYCNKSDHKRQNVTEGKSKRFQNKAADKIRFSFLGSLRINT